VNDMKNQKKISKSSTILVIFVTLVFASIYMSGMNDNIYEEGVSYELNNSHLSLSSIDTNGIPICTNGQPLGSHLNYIKRELRVYSDMEGGALITWADERAGNASIYVQKVNATGHIQWEEDGVILCPNTAYQELPVICSDGAGGAIIAWRSYRNENWDIYVQRISSDGDLVWNPEGVLISDTNSNNKYPQICTDEMGGAIITWRGNGIYVQRVNSTGDLKWTNNGIQICTGGAYHPQICADGTGGAIISWEDSRNIDFTQTDIYIQKVNATGDIQWTNNGVGMCTWGGDQRDHQMCTDGMGGAIIAYKDSYTGHLHVRMQGINSSGSVKWRSDGVYISVKSHLYPCIQICSDDEGGAYIAWADDDPDRPAVYAQHTNSTGWAQWTFGGIAISKHPGKPRICRDGVGGVIITWDQSLGIYSNKDIYAQRLDAFGNMQWAVNGTAICTASEAQWLPEICSDGSGGAIIVWIDLRIDIDLYAQRVNSTEELMWLTTIDTVEGEIPGFDLYIVYCILLITLIIIVQRKKEVIHNSEKIKK